MRRALKLLIPASLVLVCGVLLFACRTPTPPPASQFRDDWTGLFIAVTKSFGEHTYYLGSDDEWAYFRSGSISPAYRKVQAARMSLPRTFAFAQGTTYSI